jgi:hypothetical protein
MLLELRDRIEANHSHLFSHAFTSLSGIMDKSVDKSVAIAKF